MWRCGTGSAGGPRAPVRTAGRVGFFGWWNFRISSSRAAGSVRQNWPSQRWDGQFWRTLPGGDLDGGAVDAVAFQNELVVGGVFSRAGGHAIAGIARWTGQDWQPLGAGLGSNGTVSVTKIIPFEGALIVVGSFNSAGGIPAFGRARWDGSAWSAFSSGEDNEPLPVATYRGELIGVRFGVGPDQSSFDLWRWTAGAWTRLAIEIPDYSGFNRAVESADALYISGSFSTTPLCNVFEWNGVVATPRFDLPMINDALEYAGRETIATGWMPGVLVNDGAGLTALGAGSASWFNGPVVSLPSGLFGTRFAQELDDPATGITQWDGRTWRVIGAVDQDWALPARFGDELLAYGGFGEIDNVASRRIARFDGAAWHPLGDGLGEGYVNAVAKFRENLYVGGSFELGGIENVILAEWDGAAWSPILHGAYENNVRQLAVFQDELVAAGNFTGIPEIPGLSLARWNGRRWAAFGAELEYASADALTEFQGELVVAGSVKLASELYAVRVAGWNGAQWTILEPSSSKFVTALLSTGDRLVAGGTDHSIDRPITSYLATWNGSNWSPHPLALSGELGEQLFAIHSLAEHDGDLVVSGHFLRANAQPAFGVAFWGPTLAADLDHDGAVGLQDLLVVLQNFGRVGTMTRADGDLDDDRDVDLTDLAGLLRGFGVTCH
jgi:trimeric autotransporter adhesin